MTVDYNEYANEKKSFFRKHGIVRKIYTTPIDKYDTYAKSYVFEDGAEWSERYSPEEVQEEVEIKKAWATVSVKMFKTEFWSTESGSKYYYTQY